MNVRFMLAVVLTGYVSGIAGEPSGLRPKSPFRILYNNDMTHIKTCVSPYHQADDEFTMSMLLASVDEAAAAGCDAHMLAPLFTYMPPWKSAVYPIEEHVCWLKKRYPNTQISDFVRVLAEGTDIVGEYVVHCREVGVAPFLSVRMNDWHLREWIGSPPDVAMDWYQQVGLDRWRSTHPQYWFSDSREVLEKDGVLTKDRRKDLKDPDLRKRLREERVLNWKHEEVRSRLLSLIREMCTYDIAGLELDFMRRYILFEDNVPASVRSEIILDVVRQVRAMLDETGGGNYRWLSVRIPVYQGAQKAMGFDLDKLAGAGVDMFNLSASYYTVQQSDFAETVRQLPKNKAVYLEMTHAVSKDWDELDTPGKHVIRLTSPRQFRAAAHLAHARGVTGISLFNFQYYRSRSNPIPGTYQEPPFDVLRDLSDSDHTGSEDLYYFIGCARNSSMPQGNSAPLPKTITAGRSAVFQMDMALPPEPDCNAILRFQFREILNNRKFEVLLNGMRLDPATDMPDRFPVFNPVLAGAPKTRQSWFCPSRLLENGFNRIELRLLSGDDATVNFIEISGNASLPEKRK